MRRRLAAYFSADVALLVSRGLLAIIGGSAVLKIGALVRATEVVATVASAMVCLYCSSKSSIHPTLFPFCLPLEELAFKYPGAGFDGIFYVSTYTLKRR